jgi:hypothetical protein
VNNNYGSTILVPGSQHALAFFYSMDNTGPPADAAAVQAWWNATQARFPAAQLLLSSLDAFTEAILPLAEALPQVTGEIGQSWSYGAPADPAKVAAFRAARRLRNEAVDSGWLDAQDPALLAYERRLWVGGECPPWGCGAPPSWLLAPSKLFTLFSRLLTRARAPPPLSDAGQAPSTTGACALAATWARRARRGATGPTTSFTPCARAPTMPSSSLATLRSATLRCRCR